MDNEQAGEGETSQGGERILRHGERKRPFEMAFGDVAHIELIEKHIEQHIGNPDWVYHEIISDLVHIDVHVVNPTPERNFYTLITSGMSARAMTAPEGMEDCSYAELMICLPPDWPLSETDLKQDYNIWPIQLLKYLARLPHEYETWLFASHSVPNGDPPEPFGPNTELCCALLMHPSTLPEEAWALQVSPEMKIHLLAVVLLHRDEMDLKLKKGTEALIAGFEKHNVTELLDVTRRSSVKKLFGLF